MFEKFIDLLQFSEWLVGFHESNPPRVKGNISRAFIRDAGDLLQKSGVRRARICGVKKRGAISLSFSRSIPKQLHQRLRNIYGAHRG